MTVEPVTITITSADHPANFEASRIQAAVELGLGPADIVCLKIGPLTFEPESTIVDPDSGKPVRPATYTQSFTWAPEPVPEKPKPLLWPTLSLPRGARWHGTVPDVDGKPIEATLISTGDKLVLIDSQEGQAILADLGGDKPTTTVSPGNTFG